jgi:hypothetical protein
MPQNFSASRVSFIHQVLKNSYDNIEKNHGVFHCFCAIVIYNHRNERNGPTKKNCKPLHQYLQVQQKQLLCGLQAPHE